MLNFAIKIFILFKNLIETDGQSFQPKNFNLKAFGNLPLNLQSLNDLAGANQILGAWLSRAAGRQWASPV